MTELIFTSSVLILIIILLRHFLKGKISLRMQYALWALVLVRLLVPVTLFESPISVLNALRPVANIYEEQTSPPVTTAPSTLGDPEDVPPGVTVEVGPATVTNVYHHVFDWGILAKWVWYTGIVAFGLCLFLSNIIFGRKLRKTRKKFPAENYSLPVYTAEALPSPCLFGLFRPAIYITPDVAGDETKLHHVLTHELTHYRHGDHIWSVLRAVCIMVHWYNPLVWLAAMLSRRDAELACDEATIKSIGEAKRMEYGRTLIGLTCEKRRARDLLSTATTMTDGKNGIKERITLIAKKPKMLVPAFVAVLLIAFIAVGCTFTGAKNEAEIVPLTAEEMEQYNKAFEPLLSDDQSDSRINLLSHFLRPYYDKPENLNLADFLRYYPSDEDVANEAEFEALKAEKGWPFDADVTLDDMPVPIHKFSTDTVNEVLKKYMGITLDDLSGVGMNELIYLKEYDAYYNFTSDAAFGSFVCASGETQGDIIRLYSENAILTLKKQDDGFLFVSHQRTDGSLEEETDTDIGTDNTSVGISTETEWFKSFFAERSGSDLSSGQQQYIDEKTVGIGHSMTYNSWTVTVESALGDGYSAYIKVNVEAPEGTVLDGKRYSFESDSLPMLATDEQKAAVMHSGRGWELLEDKDGKNNTISLLRHSTVTMTPGSGFSYTDGVVRTLRLENLCVWQDDKEVVVAEGVWSFDIIFAESDETETGEIELISEPVLCQGQRMMGDTVEVRMISFRLSALGAVCEYEFIGDDRPEALDFQGVQAVIKDGSVMEVRPAAGSLNSITNIGDASFEFDAPIVLDEVDYFLFFNGTEISMPD